MLNATYLILTLMATSVTIFYTFFYEASVPGGQYHYSYAGIALTAALIFAGLWTSGWINKEQSKAKILTD